MSTSLIWRTLLALAAGAGAVAGLLLSYEHLHTGQICPLLGPLPACYLVFIGYALVAGSAFLKKPVASFVFWLGWVPISGLALAGTVLELGQGGVCPRTAGNIPQCFLSLAIAVALLALWLLINRTSARPHA